MIRKYDKQNETKTERMEIRCTPEQKAILMQVTRCIGWGTAIGIIASLIKETENAKSQTED